MKTLFGEWLGGITKIFRSFAEFSGSDSPAKARWLIEVIDKFMTVMP